MIEADFQREYGINLSLEIDSISWRRFTVLLNNLSGDSVYIWTLNARKDGTMAIDASDPVTSSRIMNSF